MPVLIGLCGFARVGKDTCAANLPGFQRFAFADALKGDLRPLLKRRGIDLQNPEHKEKARPFLVAYGAMMRAFQPDFWVQRLFKDYILPWQKRKPEEPIVLTDVRYVNEVREILSRGHVVIRIQRPGFGPANEEEQMSFGVIEKTVGLPLVINDSTPKVLADRVMETYSRVLLERAKYPLGNEQ